MDFYHVSERLALIAQSKYPGEPAAAQAWRERQEKALLRWGPLQLLNELRTWQPTAAAAQEVQRQQLGYFEKQAERMHYPTYLRLGFPIGSGAVEGACKHLVAERFRGTGRRWKLKPAEPLLHVRAALLTQPLLDLRPYALAAAPMA